MEEKLILISLVKKAFGIKGCVKIKSFAENNDNLKKYKYLCDDKLRKFNISKINIDNDNIIIKFKEINNRNEAEELIGTKLYLQPSQLKKDDDEFYHYELIGLDAKSMLSGDIIGIVKAIHNFGAGDIIEIEKDSDSEFYSFNKTIIPEINLIDRFIIINDENN